MIAPSGLKAAISSIRFKRVGLVKDTNYARYQSGNEAEPLGKIVFYID
jgi:hypothetical protein